MGCTRQVIRQVASDVMRAKFMAEISVYDPSMLVWLDEGGCDRRNARREYGYSLQGMRPVEHRLLIRGVYDNNYSSCSSNSGLHDIFLAECTINGARF
jgi:hypothetical protein